MRSLLTKKMLVSRPFIDLPFPSLIYFGVCEGAALPIEVQMPKCILLRLWLRPPTRFYGGNPCVFSV